MYHPTCAMCERAVWEPVSVTAPLKETVLLMRLPTVLANLRQLQRDRALVRRLPQHPLRPRAHSRSNAGERHAGDLVLTGACVSGLSFRV